MLWKKSYETGVAQMDSQHRELFRQLDILSDKENVDRVPTVLDFLGKYVDKHFRDEERMHVAHNYPKRLEHKKMHGDFVESYKQLMQEYEEKSDQQGLMTLRINRAAVDWLRRHILGPDMMFARFLREKEESEGDRPPSVVETKIRRAPRVGAVLPEEQKEKQDGMNTALGGKGSTSSRRPISTAARKDLGGNSLALGDEAVLRRVPVEALAAELVRRAVGSHPLGSRRRAEREFEGAPQ